MDHDRTADDLNMVHAHKDLAPQALHQQEAAQEDHVEAHRVVEIHADHHAVPLPAQAVPRMPHRTASTFHLQQKASFASSHSVVLKKSVRT